MTAEQLVEAQGLSRALTFAVQILQVGTRAFPMWSLPEPEVASCVATSQHLKTLSETMTAVLAGEAHSRGLGAEDGLSRPDWLAAQAPGMEGGAAAGLAMIGKALQDERWAALADKLRTGKVTVDVAKMLLNFHKDVHRIADPKQLDELIDTFIDQLEAFSPKELRRLLSYARTALKPDSEQEAEEAGRRLGRALKKVGKTAGFTEYRLRLDDEGSAILDAAIDPLARPRPDLDWEGVEKDDPRTPECRRADALLELVGRAVGAPEGQTRTPRTKVVVTIGYEALLGKVRGAGLADNDAVLSPSTVRRMACEADIVAAVMDGPSVVLDLGVDTRFFSPAQRIALAARDKGCSFPGCTMPPQWCEAHHVKHHIDGGETSLSNGALLCGRHHTIVHERGLTAIVTATGVTWLLNGRPLRVGPAAPPPPPKLTETRPPSEDRKAAAWASAKPDHPWTKDRPPGKTPAWDLATKGEPAIH